ncbi:unnamed protein product, partial [Nesidiocoris tenuis]
MSKIRHVSSRHFVFDVLVPSSGRIVVEKVEKSLLHGNSSNGVLPYERRIRMRRASQMQNGRGHRCLEANTAVKGPQFSIS